MDDFNDEIEIAKPTKPYDVIMFICSSGRRENLQRLLHSLSTLMAPAITATNLTWAIAVYAQNYEESFLDELDESQDYPFFLARQTPHMTHETIGHVVRTGVEECDGLMTEAVGYGFNDAKIIMMIDDDSLFFGDMLTNINIQISLRDFINSGMLLFSIRTGQAHSLLRFQLLVEAYPAMPGKEKMMWVRPDILRKAIDLPPFDRMTIGEDALIAATAWLTDHKLCSSVYGFPGFIHIGTEQKPMAGGLDALPEPQEHFTPCDALPDFFVPKFHPMHGYYGIRPEVISRIQDGVTTNTSFELG